MEKVYAHITLLYQGSFRYWETAVFNRGEMCLNVSYWRSIWFSSSFVLTYKLKHLLEEAILIQWSELNKNLTYNTWVCSMSQCVNLSFPLSYSSDPEPDLMVNTAWICPRLHQALRSHLGYLTHRHCVVPAPVALPGCPGLRDLLGRLRSFWTKLTRPRPVRCGRRRRSAPNGPTLPCLPLNRTPRIWLRHQIQHAQIPSHRPLVAKCWTLPAFRTISTTWTNPNKLIESRQMGPRGLSLAPEERQDLATRKIKMMSCLSFLTARLTTWMAHGEFPVLGLQYLATVL